MKWEKGLIVFCIGFIIGIAFGYAFTQATHIILIGYVITGVIFLVSGIIGWVQFRKYQYFPKKFAQMLLLSLAKFLGPSLQFAQF